MANESSAHDTEISASTAEFEAAESSASTAEFAAAESSASTAEFEALGARLRCVGRQSNHSVIAQLLHLNQQHRRLEAELLLYLGELDKRQIYREQSTASAFEFCVSRMGYSEDVAFKRVGAARLMRRFPLVYELLVTGRIHLTALMLLKPHLTMENHEEWLLLACEKSKRQVEQLVASRCPRPDVPSSVRQLPGRGQSPLEAQPGLAATNRAGVGGVNGQASAPIAQATPAQATPAQAIPAQATPAPVGTVPVLPRERAAAQVTPLSSRTYRVTFTASERLKLKLDRAFELLSHCIHPSDVPALVERALDQLLEREEKRRYGACSPSNHRSVETAVELDHKSCQEAEQKPGASQDPDLASAPIGHGESSATSRTSAKQGGAEGRCSAMANAKRRRSVPAAVRRVVFERDGGQCTFIDQHGRRCQQRHLLEFDHVDAHALGGPETVTNLRIRCASHNSLEAERLFGRERVKSAIKHAQQIRTR